MRPPLSNAEEESIFQRMDDACDACAAGLKDHILRRWEEQARGMNRPMLAMALTYGAPSAVGVAAQPIRPAWSRAFKFSKPKVVQKATPKLTYNEEEAIAGLLDTGIELGLETLPAKIRDKVDTEAARALARRRLSRAAFRRNLAAFDDAMRGLERIVEASRNPSLAVLKDVERLASMFGLNARQAEIIVRETETLVAHKKNLEAIRRVMARRIRQALEANAELLGQTLAQEAISTAQQALYEVAKRQGLLDDEKHLKEWVTRARYGATNVCPRCLGFDHKRVPVDEMFVSDSGERAYQPGIHPRCQCRTRLVTQRTASRPRRSQSRAA